jgi:uncharacterized protein (TIGR03492 family)
MHLNTPFCYNEVMYITLISNGHGEDLIAKQLILAIKESTPSAHFDIFPLVGLGHSFTDIGLKIALKNPAFPSGGFIRHLKDLLIDIRQGLVSHIFRQRKAIKKSIKKSDAVIAVGDIFCLFQSRNNKQVPTTFLPTAKSDTFMPHSFLEKMMMRRHCTYIFPRDEVTHAGLQKASLPSTFCGNVMMDDLQINIPGDEGLEGTCILGILPGSRDEAFENLAHIVKIINYVKTQADIYVALSPALDPDKAQAILAGTNIKATRHFKALINQADLIIGLAGTANEQAAYMDVPVICFPGFGPQSTTQRFKEQALLMQKNIHFYPTQSPKELANIVDERLSQKREKHVPDKSNAAKKIIKKIF